MMGSLRAFACVSLFALLALTGKASAGEIPFLSGRVNDYAGMLSLETTQRLAALLKAHEDSTSNQVVLLIISSLEGEGLEEFSIRVVESWKLGQKGKDNGVLLLVARDDRKVRIEVGRGLEGDLPDITCGIIIRKEIVPRFKSGDFGGGVTAGIEAILAAIKGSYVTDETDGEGSSGDLAGRLMAGSIFLVVVGVFTFFAFVTRGGQSWFLYCFLLLFWAAFPMAILGLIPGAIIFATYALGFPLLKVLFARSAKGKALYSKWTSTGGFLSSGGFSSGSGGGSGSSSSSSFSGGGGSFSGGGSSGSW